MGAADLPGNPRLRQDLRKSDRSSGQVAKNWKQDGVVVQAGSFVFVRHVERIFGPDPRHSTPDADAATNTGLHSAQLPRRQRFPRCGTAHHQAADPVKAARTYLEASG
jgi:hypothetical protein